MPKMKLFILIISCVVFKRCVADSESDPDYAVAYNAAVAYLKANPFTLNQEIYIQVEVDGNSQSSANQEIQDIHLPSKLLKEIQESYVEKKPVIDQPYIDVQLPYKQKESLAEPYVDIQVPSEPYADSRVPYLYQAKPYIHQANPYVHNEVPYVHDEEPYVHEEEPYVHEEEPYVHEEPPYVDVEKQYTDKREPNRLQETLYEHAKPYVDIQLTLRVPYDQFKKTSGHFADPALEYAYGIEQRHPRQMRQYGSGQRYKGQYSSIPVYAARYGSTSINNNKYGATLKDFYSLQYLVDSVQRPRNE